MLDHDIEHPHVDQAQFEALMRVVERIVRESGSKGASAFQVGPWLSDWLRHPLPAYGERSPAEMLKRPDAGFDLVSTTLQRMQSMAYS